MNWWGVGRKKEVFSFPRVIQDRWCDEADGPIRLIEGRAFQFTGKFLRKPAQMAVPLHKIF